MGHIWVGKCDRGQEFCGFVKRGSRKGSGSGQLTEGAGIDRASELTTENSGADDEDGGGGQGKWVVAHGGG